VLLVGCFRDNFRMRFTTEKYTTEWHRCDIEISAGCTISVIWFITVIDFTEDITKVKSSKKTFIDDVTLLTRDQQMLQSVLVLGTLDELITWSKMKFKTKK
jgi:hypothetical protein